MYLTLCFDVAIMYTELFAHMSMIRFLQRWYFVIIIIIILLCLLFMQRSVKRDHEIPLARLYNYSLNREFQSFSDYCTVDPGVNPVGLQLTLC